MNTQVYMTYSEKVFYFITKGFQKKIFCALVSHPENKNNKNDLLHGYCEK